MFINFLIEKLSHLRYAYKSDKEMIEHFLSGEVTLPITDVLKFVQEWKEKSNEIQDIINPKSFIIPQ